MAALEPGEIGELWLEKHNDTPHELRPVVFSKAPSAREQRRLAKQFDEIFAAPDPDAMSDRALEMFCDWVTGWRNFKSEYSRETVEDEFTVRGMMEIIRGVLSGAMTSIDDKKKLESPH